MLKASRWTRRVMRWLRRNSEFVEIALIPFFIFMLDLIIRASLRLDLIDAGADMSLLAVSAFMSGFMDNVRRGDPDNNRVIEVLLLLFFGMLWLICLMFISDLNPVSRVLPCLIAVRQFVVWSIGLMAFVLSSLFLIEFAGPSSVAP